ncbi:hypothetical protein ACFLIM_45745 [Nonomuraea sp. M3C6]|uniref:Uncharacterized protein n=1 Tax=Nonomuraea marmarensis TaxID=3351344 RepID=A0ABW7ASU6_9ACTN
MEAKRAALSGWAHQHGDVPEQLQAALKREAFRRDRQASRRYRLKGLGRGLPRLGGGVHADFHEFITIERTTGDLTMIVAADELISTWVIRRIC